MNTLSEYICKNLMVNEANAKLPADANEKINQYFNKIAPALKDIEKAAGDEFGETWRPYMDGATVAAGWICSPKEDEKVREKFTDAIKNNKKWILKGRKYENMGRGYHRPYDVYEIKDEEVTYTIQAVLSSFRDEDYYVEARLLISYPMVVVSTDINFVPNTSDKSKDITGEPIAVGDTVAYSSRAVSGNVPMPIGVVTEATPKQITVYDKINNNLAKIPGFKCCVVKK